MSRPGRRKQATAVRQRRMYVDWRHGQLHLRCAFPPSGGFDELTPLVCLHGEGETSRVFTGLLARLGGDRSVYAPDLPGSGESDPPPRRTSAADCAAAVADFLEQMRLRQADVLGHRWGGLVAAELALARPAQVRRIVLVSAPLTASARELPEHLSGLQQPVLALAPNDDRRDIMAGISDLLPGARLVDLPQLGAGALESAADDMAGHVRSFLG